MARFVKYTHESETAGGKKTSLVFINVDHISKAVFKDDQLELIWHSGIPVANKHDIVTLKGQEAKDALEVIRSLS